MTNIEKVKDIVKNYQKLADRRFSEYNKRVSEVRDRYKPEVALTEIRQNIWPQAAGSLWAEKENAKQKIEEVCEDIRADIKKWTLKPVSANTLELLHSIHDFKVQLTISELKMIETEVAGNLIASKIFAGLASEYGYYIEVPNIDGLLQELRELESFAKTAIDAYVGQPSKEGFPGNDLLEQKKINGAPAGEYQVWEKAVAADFLTKNNTLQRTAELLEESKVSLAYSLTEKETSRIKGLIDDIEKNSISDDEKMEKISTLLKSEPDMYAKIDFIGGDIKDLVVRMLTKKNKKGVVTSWQ